MWPVEDYAPPESFVRISQVERDGGAKAGAAVFASFCLHRRFCPVICIAAMVIPTAAQSGVAENRAFQAGEELEFYGLCSHGDYP
ncbi:hypothetical protein [Thiothrix caldifontis]|uniref:hypothetical protein n=1 Tax=Thiothrix caldifontis TaxID=525918 RepID=UPI001C317FC2|nr:hypothetical protein [Thiothrix caldifontis]